MTDINELEIEVLRNFYNCWKAFHKISNAPGSSDKALGDAITLLVTAAHAVETVQKPKILLLDS